MDEFIKSKFIEENLESLSPEERQAHTLNVVKALMECIVSQPVKFIDIGVKAGLLDPIAVVKPKPKSRAINPLRHREDGSYNSHSLVPGYNHKYYEEKMKGVQVTCPCCGLEFLKTNFSKHKKS